MGAKDSPLASARQMWPHSSAVALATRSSSWHRPSTSTSSLGARQSARTALVSRGFAVPISSAAARIRRRYSASSLLSNSTVATRACRPLNQSPRCAMARETGAHQMHQAITELPDRGAGCSRVPSPRGTFRSQDHAAYECVVCIGHFAWCLRVERALRGGWDMRHTWSGH